jgi:lauroyl/myristoyl acyltransferase
MTTSGETSSVPAAGAAPRWYGHRLNRGVWYRAMAAVAAVLPRALRLRLAAAVAGVLRRPFAVERAVVGDNVARIRPEATPAERTALVDDVFRHFAMCLSDLVSANRRDGIERLLGAIEGEHHLAATAEAGGGAVVLTAHLGNWEVAGRLMALRIGRPTHVVVAPEADRSVERFLRGGPAPVRFVPRNEPRAALPLVSALRRGELVAMQGDRALGGRGDVRVPFFSREAAFPLGPFVLARAAGVPVIPAFCLLGRDRRYAVRIGEPMRVPVDGERAALVQWVTVLERIVRAHPEQWFNFFDVWGMGPAR